jgi:hypothetical protein
MNKRRYKRVDFRLNADIIYGNKNYKGHIENFSETGIFKIVFPEERVVDFIPGTVISVKFQVPSGEILNLDCEIRWLRINTDSPFALKYHMGMEIIEPPQEYRQFLSSIMKKSSIPEAV